MLAEWPKADPALSFPAEEQAMEKIMAAINAVRSRRAEMNVPPSKKAHLTVVTAHAQVFQAGVPFLKRLAGAEAVTITGQTPACTDGMVSVVTADAQMYIPLAELVDLEKERARVAKELEQARANLKRLEGKLANESFVSKAPEVVVNAEREKAEKARSLIAQLEETAAGLR